MLLGSRKDCKEALWKMVHLGQKSKELDLKAVILGTLYIAKLILDINMQVKASKIAVDFRLYYVDFCNAWAFEINFNTPLIFGLFLLFKTVLDRKNT